MGTSSQVFPICCRLFYFKEKISVLTVLCKERHGRWSCLSFRFRSRWPLHPSVFQMFGASELLLRQGFRRRRKRLYGANAPPARWPVGAFAGRRANLRISILTILAARRKRHIACDEFFHFIAKLNSAAPRYQTEPVIAGLRFGSAASRHF